MLPENTLNVSITLNEMINKLQKLKNKTKQCFNKVPQIYDMIKL